MFFLSFFELAGGLRRAKRVAKREMCAYDVRNDGGVGRGDVMHGKNLVTVGRCPVKRQRQRRAKRVAMEELFMTPASHAL